MKRKALHSMILVVSLLCACGHTAAHRVGLISLGNLEGATISSDGAFVQGQDCGHAYSLANATRDALKETPYDTIVDADVTNTTGIFVWSNCITVKGRALNSRTLDRPGGVR